MEIVAQLVTTAKHRAVHSKFITEYKNMSEVSFKVMTKDIHQKKNKS